MASGSCTVRACVVVVRRRVWTSDWPSNSGTKACSGISWWALTGCRWPPSNSPTRYAVSSALDYSSVCSSAWHDAASDANAFLNRFLLNSYHFAHHLVKTLPTHVYLIVGTHRTVNHWNDLWSGLICLIKLPWWSLHEYHSFHSVRAYWRR